MTPEQYTRFREVAIAHFSAALREAVPLVDQDEAGVRTGLFPLWLDALHSTLVDVGICPCTHHEAGCVLQWTEAEQLSHFPSIHSLSFDSFVDTFREGAALAKFALRKFHTDTH